MTAPHLPSLTNENNACKRCVVVRSTTSGCVAGFFGSTFFHGKVVRGKKEDGWRVKFLRVGGMGTGVVCLSGIQVVLFTQLQCVALLLAYIYHALISIPQSLTLHC